MGDAAKGFGRSCEWLVYPALAGGLCRKQILTAHSEPNGDCPFLGRIRTNGAYAGYDSSGAVESGSDPGYEFIVDFIRVGYVYLILAHAAGWKGYEAVGRIDIFHIETDFDARFGSWSDHGELFFASQAHIARFGGDIESPEGVDGGHQFIVNGPKGSF